MTATLQEAQKRRAETYADSLRGEYEERQAAAQELVSLLVARLGDDLGRTITLMEKARADPTLIKALREAHKQAQPARKGKVKPAGASA